MRMLSEGNERRKTESTKANAVSSRSHAILQVYTETKTDNNEIRSSKLNLIDLAGSERGSVTQTRKGKAEGANINKSLLALGNCINALVDKSFVFLNCYFCFCCFVFSCFVLFVTDFYCCFCYFRGANTEFQTYTHKKKARDSFFCVKRKKSNDSQF